MRGRHFLAEGCHVAKPGGDKEMLFSSSSSPTTSRGYIDTYLWWWRSVGMEIQGNSSQSSKGNKLPNVEDSCTKHHLLVIEEALMAILQQENHLPADGNLKRKMELRRRLRGRKDLPAEDMDGGDVDLLSQILDQVHIMKEQKGWYDEDSENKVSIDEKHEISHTPNEIKERAVSGEGLNDTKLVVVDDDDQVSKKGLNDPKLAGADIIRAEISNVGKVMKKVERQNTVTHRILWFMLITTAIWRFETVSMVLGIQRTVCNPFQVVGSFFSKGLKGWKKGKNHNILKVTKEQIILPPFLQGDESPKEAHEPSE